MRVILVNEICNEKPNSSALGAFNDAVSFGQSMAQSYIDKGDIKSATEYWKGAMISGVKDTKGMTAKDAKGINNAYAQAIGANRALDNNSKQSFNDTKVTKSQVSTINKMSESKLGKNIDIVRSQMQTVLNRHNPKTGIVGKDKEVYARLQAREKLYINARSKKTK